jgi:hypothetical protein
LHTEEIINSDSEDSDSHKNTSENKVEISEVSNIKINHNEQQKRSKKKKKKNMSEEEKIIYEYNKKYNEISNLRLELNELRRLLSADVNTLLISPPLKHYMFSNEVKNINSLNDLLNDDNYNKKKINFLLNDKNKNNILNFFESIAQQHNDFFNFYELCRKKSVSCRKYYFLNKKILEKDCKHSLGVNVSSKHEHKMFHYLNDFIKKLYFLMISLKNIILFIFMVTNFDFAEIIFCIFLNLIFFVF